ncbi:MAG: C1 family peptidase [Bauldia sp.]|nr:C1 family peptidase [Bauldia sp.]
MARTSRSASVSAKKAGSKKSGSKSAASRRKRILNCIPSVKTEEDWTFENAAAAGITAMAAVPPSKDLREDWWRIGDQGSTGSCVGWATADSVVRWHLTKAGRIATSERLSPRFVWMASKEIDEFNTRPTTFIEPEGTSLKAALDVARKFGVVKESVLPFSPARLFQGSAQTFYALAAQLKIASYINLGRNLAAWRNWLANNGPILVRLDVDATWMNARATQGRLDVYDATTAQGGHAVALVGYDMSMFIVRNSWGTTLWGDRGFGYAANGYAMAAFTEAYGVTVA